MGVTGSMRERSQHGSDPYRHLQRRDTSSQGPVRWSNRLASPRAHALKRSYTEISKLSQQGDSE